MRSSNRERYVDPIDPSAKFFILSSIRHEYRLSGMQARCAVSRFLRLWRLMKALVLVGCVFVGAQLHGQVLLTDDFSGGSLNTSIWTTILPTGNSSIVQGGGVLTTRGRGVLGTVASFAGPYTVSGSFAMEDGLEHFDIVLRSNLSSAGAGASYERAGLLIEFINDGQGISIDEFTDAANHNQIISTGPGGFAFTTGQFYTFSLTDTGSAVSLAVNGNLILSANTTFAMGSQIGFYSREFPSTSTQIDSVTITAITPVPEPSVYGLVGATLTLGLGLWRKHAARKGPR